MAVLDRLLVQIGVDADAVDRQLSRVDQAFEQHGGKIAAAGAAIGAGGGAAIAQGVQVGLEKEAIGDKLAAQLGATGPEAVRLGKVSGNLYSQGLGEGMQDVSDAVGAVVSSIDGMRGASNQAIESMSAKALNLGKAFEVDVARSVQVVGQIVKSGLVRDAGQGMDLLAASMQKVPAAVREDLVDALDEYSPFMRQIGVKGEAAFSLLVQSAQKGAFGIDKTGDALKEFTLRATDMSSGTKEAYDAIGLSQKAMTADLLAGGDKGAQAFQQIVGGLMGIKDPTERAKQSIALFGTPLEDLSTQDIPKFLASLDTTKNTLGDTAGAADKLGQTLNDNAATGIESWKRKTDSALASMTNAPGVFGDTAQAATGITQSLAPIGADLGGIALAALAGGKIFGSVGKAAATAATKVGLAAKTVAVSAGRMAATMAVATARVVAGWTMMGIRALISAAMMAVSWLIAFWPAILIVAIVALVVGLIIKYWDQIVAFFTETLPRWIRQGATFIIGIIKWLAKVGFFGPVGLIIAHWDKIKKFFMETIPAALRTFGSWVVSIIKKAAKLGFLGPIGLILAHWTRIQNFFTQTLPNAIRGGVSRVVGFMRSLPGRIRSAVGNLGSLLWNAGKNVVQGLINGITSRFGALASKAREMASKIRNVLPFSPAKEGPLSGRGSPEIAGGKVASMLAAGMRGGRRGVAAAASGLAGAAAVNGSAVVDPGAIATPAGVRGAGASGNGVDLTLRSDGSRLMDLFVELLREAIEAKGGDVQTVLGT